LGPQSYNQKGDSSLSNIVYKRPNGKLSPDGHETPRGPKAAIIGTAKREYDPIRYSQNNKILVLKGLY
jgi:hypothetical protein